MNVAFSSHTHCNVTSFANQYKVYKSYLTIENSIILVRGSGSTVIRFSAAFIMQITVSNESILVKYANKTGTDQHGRLINLISTFVACFLKRLVDDTGYI